MENYCSGEGFYVFEYLGITYNQEKKLGDRVK